MQRRNLPRENEHAVFFLRRGASIFGNDKKLGLGLLGPTQAATMFFNLASLQEQKCEWSLYPMGPRLHVVEAAGRQRCIQIGILKKHRIGSALCSALPRQQ